MRDNLNSRCTRTINLPPVPFTPPVVHLQLRYLCKFLKIVISGAQGRWFKKKPEIKISWNSVMPFKYMTSGVKKVPLRTVCFCLYCFLKSQGLQNGLDEWCSFIFRVFFNIQYSAYFCIAGVRTTAPTWTTTPTLAPRLGTKCATFTSCFSQSLER